MFVETLLEMRVLKLKRDLKYHCTPSTVLLYYRMLLVLNIYQQKKSNKYKPKGNNNLAKMFRRALPRLGESFSFMRQNPNVGSV